MELIELPSLLDVFYFSLKKVKRLQFFLLTKMSAILHLVKLIENKCDKFYQVLFHFTRVIESDSLPSTFTYSSAEGT